MDPNANLDEQLQLAMRLLGADCSMPNDCERLAELVIVMNDWLSHGGFLPDRWLSERRKQHRSTVNVSAKAHQKLALDIEKLRIMSELPKEELTSEKELYCQKL